MSGGAWRAGGRALGARPRGVRREGVAGEVVKCNNSKEEALSAAGISVVKPGQLNEAMAVVGGTTWMFCKEELADQFDWLVVDEAGQMSLANLLVMARCARSILLVGDQQQLAQPSQADHPGDSGQSCLEYWMEGAWVVPDDRGVFLDTSWRMEPSLTAMVSALVAMSQEAVAMGKTAINR